MGCSACILRPLSPHTRAVLHARVHAVRHCRPPRPHSAVRSRCRAHLSCPALPARVPLPCAPSVRLGGRARCPHRAAAPSARCAAWHPVRPCHYAAGQVAHAESFACRGSVRDTVRGRAAHPARCHDRAAIYQRALCTPHCPWRLATPALRSPPRCIARGGSPPRAPISFLWSEEIFPDRIKITFYWIPIPVPSIFVPTIFLFLFR